MHTLWATRQSSTTFKTVDLLLKTVGTSFQTKTTSFWVSRYKTWYFLCSHRREKHSFPGKYSIKPEFYIFHCGIQCWWFFHKYLLQRIQLSVSFLPTISLRYIFVLAKSITWFFYSFRGGTFILDPIGNASIVPAYTRADSRRKYIATYDKENPSDSDFSGKTWSNALRKL